MKKLRCENCGGELKVEDNNEYATCGYCRTRYKLNEDKTVTIKFDDDLKEMYMDTYRTNRKIMKPAMIISIIISFIIFVGVVFGFVTGISAGSKDSHNFYYENNKGTKSYFLVCSMLDEVSTNNQTKKRKITVVYNDKEYVDYNDVINLKKVISTGDSFEDAKRNFEIKIEYDEKGYVNKIIIEDIK